MLKDHAGGMRNAGLGVESAESFASKKTEESDGFWCMNWSVIGMFTGGAEYLETQKENVEDAESTSFDSFAVIVISGWPSSVSEGVP